MKKILLNLILGGLAVLGMSLILPENPPIKKEIPIGLPMNGTVDRHASYVI